MKGEESLVMEEDADLYDAPSPPPPPDQGSFFSWGCGEFGQHCHKRSGDVLFMEGFVKKFSGSHGNKIKHMACGASHTIVVTSKYRVIVEIVVPQPEGKVRITLSLSVWNVWCAISLNHYNYQFVIKLCV